MKKKDNSVNRPFGLLDKLAYAAGDFGCNMSFSLNSYLMLFYTQYIGLSLTDWGIIILILKIWDGINDPIMGGLMDSIRPGKRGKFKTYIYYGSFLLIFSGALCFLPIPNAPYWVKMLVCILAYLMWDMSYTIVNVPYGAMSNVITADPVERSELSTWRTIGSFSGNILLSIALPMICYDAANNLLGGRIIYIALVMGVLGFIAFKFLLDNTVERVHAEEEVKEKPKYNYFKALGGFFKNRAAVGCTIATMFTIVMTQSMASATQVLYQSFFQNARISGIMGLVSYLPMVLIMPFIKPLVKKFGKKEASVYSMIIGIVAGVGIAVLPIEPTTIGMIIYVVMVMLVNLSIAMFTVVGWAMVADCIDYQEYTTGQREEGTIYATYSLGRKLAQGFGASIISFLLILTGYISENGAAQTFEVANNVRCMIGWVYAVGVAFTFIILNFVYNLDKKTVAEMENALGRNNEHLIGEKGEDD